MRYLFLFLALMCSGNVFADYWFFSYYLYGRITDNNHVPAANLEMSLVQGDMIRHFKTDDEGNYKVEVIAVKGCLSGNQPGNTRFVHAKQDEMAINGKKLSFYAGTAFADMPSRWQEIDSLNRYHGVGSYDSAGKYFRKMDVTLNQMLPTPNPRLLKSYNEEKKKLADSCSGSRAPDEDDLRSALFRIVHSRVDFHKRSIGEIEKLLSGNCFFKLKKTSRDRAYRLSSPLYDDYMMFLMDDKGLVDYCYVVEKKN